MAARKKSKLPDPIDCTMSLGDHLEELRARLILAILGLFIGAVVSLIFGKHIIEFIEKPYKDAMEPRVERMREQFADPNVVALFEIFFTNLGLALEDDPNAPRIDPNQVEFYRRVWANSAIAWNQAMQPEGELPLPPGYRLVTLAPAEAFVAYMKISLISGLILTCPWVFYQLWMFVAAGLYEHERNYVRTAVPFSAALFVVGALFFLFVVAPISLRFFLGFNDLLGVASNWTLQKYVSFVTLLMLVFGLGFQTPIAVFILARTGLVSLQALRSVRKYVFLSVFIISAAVTPPDVISQVTLGLPLYGLYELGMLLALLASKRAEQKERQEGQSAAKKTEPKKRPGSDEKEQPDTAPPSEDDRPDDSTGQTPPTEPPGGDDEPRPAEPSAPDEQETQDDSSSPPDDERPPDTGYYDDDGYDYDNPGGYDESEYPEEPED
jgi:sec-independent protein translocase protein TatC